jgi:hypothetical protein
MRALQQLCFVVVVVVAACKGKGAEPAAGATGSAVVTGSAGGAAIAGSAAGSATAGSATGSAGSDVATAPAGSDAVAGKPYVGPTFTVTPSLSAFEIKKKDIDTDAGKTTMTMYEFTDPADDNVVQMVESNPIPANAGAIAKLIDSAIEGMTEDVKATISDRHLAHVGSVRGTDFTASFVDENGLFYMRGRVAIKDNTLYQVIAIGKGDVTPAANAFAESFQLK